MRPRSVNVAAWLIAGLILAAPTSVVADAAAGTPIQLTVRPSLFSPNADGRLDEATITVGADQPATLRIEIVDGNGTSIRAWTQSVSPGTPASITWDGKVENVTVPDGGYLVRARGETPLDLVEEAKAPVTVDTLDPEARWEGGSPVLTTQDHVAFRFRIEDASSPLRVRLGLEDRYGAIGSAEKSVRGGDGRIAWPTESANGRDLFPGTYFATLTVLDWAGNLARLPRVAWRVHTPRAARVVHSMPSAGRLVALTIDDCHYPEAWSRMLRSLDQHEAGATFFCPGKQILANPALARRTIRDGHEIGSHGWDHALLTGMSEAQITSRLRKDADALWRVAQRSTAPYFRPAEGANDRTVIAAAGRTAHPRVVMWDVDPQDWRRPGVAAIVSHVVEKARPGSIVVLHTIEQTAIALPAIISGLRKRGLEPVGLAELFEDAPGRSLAGGSRRLPSEARP